jgi:putative endopeptidase
MKKLFYFSVALLLAGACKQASDTDSKHVVVTGIDFSKNPGDDFFIYANGIWYDTAQIPASQTGVGSYSFMNYPQRIRLQAILDSVSSANNPAGSIEQKVADFYASGLDTVAINKRGYEPIKPILASVDAITDVPSMMKFVAEVQKTSNGSIIGFRVGPDAQHSSVNIVSLSQTGIGLPERDFISEQTLQQLAFKTLIENT